MVTVICVVSQAVAGVQRRTWDKEAAAQRQKEKDAALEDGGAQEKARKIREKPVERNPLSAEVSRAGAGNTDYMGQIGKVKMATAKDATKDRVGAFYCPVTILSPPPSFSVGDTNWPSERISSSLLTRRFCSQLTGKTFSDNITYLDHINGKKYQRELGMNMRVERSSKDDVSHKHVFCDSNSHTARRLNEN